MSDFGASSGQAYEGKQPQAGNSGLQRLKREKAQLQSTLEDMSKRMASLEQQVTQSASQQPQASSNDPSTWSLSDLESYATRQDVIEEAPHAANQAMLLAMKKMLKDSMNEVRGELRNEYTETFTQRQQADAVKDSITRDFGQDAWNTDGELFQEADLIYRQYQNKFGKPGKDGQVELDPYYLRTAFLEAKQNLSARESQEALRAETPVEQAVNQPQGPAPQDRVEGMSEGIADALAERRQAVEAGDVQGAFQSVARSMYPT